MNPLRIPIWQEARIGLERAALSRDPVLRGQGVPRGDGMPVLLIPGFMAGDLSLSLMSTWLGRMGYEPCRAGIRANVDCTGRAIDRLEAAAAALRRHHGRPVTIVGHSRGRAMARILAVRRPDLVHGIVCLGSPLIDQFAVHPLVRAQVEAVATLGTLGLHGLFRRDCLAGQLLRSGARARRSRRSRSRPASPRSTRAATASSTGRRAWTPPPGTSRFAPATAAWPSTARCTPRSDARLRPRSASPIRARGCSAVRSAAAAARACSGLRPARPGAHGMQHDLAAGVALLEHREGVPDLVERIGGGDRDLDLARGDELGQLG